MRSVLSPSMYPDTSLTLLIRIRESGMYRSAGVNPRLTGRNRVTLDRCVRSALGRRPQVHMYSKATHRSGSIRAVTSIAFSTIFSQVSCSQSPSDRISSRVRNQ